MDENTYARFWVKVNKNGPVPASRPELGPCWLWIPQASNGGYGQFYLNGKPRLAHRASYMLFVGPIPDGLTIDHLCRTRCCIRFSHLEAVTLLENLRRAEVWKHGAEAQRSKTHCPNGHPYDEANTRVSPSGRRHCRACARARAARRRERFREEAPPQPRRLKEFCANGHSFAEFGVQRRGQRVCTVCARESLRKSRARKKAANPPAPKMACKHGHPWTEENVYTDPEGRKSCRACRKERTLAAYRARGAAAEGRPPKPPRETCKNGHPWTPENLFQTVGGYDRCRLCRQQSRRRFEAKLSEARQAEPKPERTTCRNGHDLTGENAYVSAGGHRTCRECARLRREARAERIASGGPAAIDPARSSWQRDKTHCKNGHEFTPENTITRPDGGRKCRECGRIKGREYMRRKRAAAKAARAA